MPEHAILIAYLRRMIAGMLRIVELSRVFETNYPTIRSTFVQALTETSLSYLSGNRKDVTLHSAQRATALAYMQAANAGFRVNAPAGERMESDDAEFVAAETDDELGFVEALWNDLAGERAAQKGGDVIAPDSRIAMFARSLDSLYNEMVMRGQKYRMGTWRIGETEHSCSTCAKLDGQRHRLQWYLNRNYIPRKPGASMDCGGYNCLCSIVDDDGNEILLEG